jgi:hypothetical protein
MTLIYRGHAYQRPSSSVESESKTVQLIYRGQKFEYTPRPFPADSNLARRMGDYTGKLEKLIYRGQSFDYVPLPPQPYCKPRAMNWRYEMVAQAAIA